MRAASGPSAVCSPLVSEAHAPQANGDNTRPAPRKTSQPLAHSSYGHSMAYTGRHRRDCDFDTRAAQVPDRTSPV